NFRRTMREMYTRDGSDNRTALLVGTHVAEFEASLDDNFNTANALAAGHNLVREINTLAAADQLLTDDRELVLAAIPKFNTVLGIFGPEESTILDNEIEKLIEERQDARHNRNFARSDEIRDLLAEKGIILEDTK